MNGKRLRELREAKGMSPATIDEYLGVMRGSCSNWENGYAEPEEELIEDLAGYFRVSVKELKEEPKEEKKTMAEKKNFTEEQKAEILKYAEDTTAASAAKQYGVSTVTISRWKAAAKVTDKADKTKAKAKATRKKAADKVEEVKEEIKADVTETKEEVKAAAEKEKAKVTAKRTARKNAKEEKAAEKAAAKEEKAAEKAEKKVERAANKPSNKVKTVKVNMIFQSTMGGSITPEQIALKVPKDTTDAYVKLEDNKIYYVLKDGSTGAVDIWS